MARRVDLMLIKKKEIICPLKESEKMSEIGKVMEHELVGHTNYNRSSGKETSGSRYPKEIRDHADDRTIKINICSTEHKIFILFKKKNKLKHISSPLCGYFCPRERHCFNKKFPVHTHRIQQVDIICKTSKRVQRLWLQINMPAET